MEGRGKEAARPQKNRTPNSETIVLYLSALATGVHVHQSEGCPFARIRWLDGYDVLLVSRPDFQLGDRAGVLVALQFFVLGILVLVHVKVVAMFLCVALYNFAIFLE